MESDTLSKMKPPPKRSLEIYWSAYGGWPALLKSKYLWLSGILTCVLFPAWMKPGWWDSVLNVMPNMLGFTLGGYAMWMAIGNDSFRKLISGRLPGKGPSPYMSVNAAFVHFVILQVASILLALLASAFYFPLPSDHLLMKALGEFISIATYVVWAISYWVFIYALLSALAATFALLRVSSWYDDMESRNRNKKPEN